MATKTEEFVTGTGTTIGFTTQYINESDIKVRVAGGSPLTFIGTTGTPTTGQYKIAANSTTITFGDDRNGQSLHIYSETDVSGPTVSFTPGSSIKAADLQSIETLVRHGIKENRNQIITADIRADNITSALIADDQINSEHYVAGSIDHEHLANDIIDGDNIQNDVINSEHYVAGSIDHEHLANDIIDGDTIQDNSIDSEHYVDGSIDHVHLANDVIDGDNIQDDVINSEHYVAGSIDTEHIANENITTAKLANTSVTSAKLAANSVTTAKITDANVTTAKIADDAVTTDKLANSINAEITANTAKTTNQTHTGDVTGSTSLTIANDAVTTAKIAADAVTGAKIADNAIDSEHYTDGSIDTIHIGDSQITTAKIADGAITDAKIAGGSLDNRYYTETELDAGQLDNRYYTETELNAGQLDNRYFTETELTNGALDGRYFTETEADARYFNISTGDTIKDGDTFPDNDTTIATTAAINDRIIDLVDDVGGFVPIASETNFPTANPDVNNGAGTLVSIKSIGSTRTPSGGTVSISNGSGSNTVTITGCGSTVLTAGFGVIVETTSTLHTYAFHRLVPKATEVSTVAANATNIAAAGANTTNINTVAGINSNVSTVAGISGNVTTVAGISSNVTTVAGISSDVTAVANDATDIGAVAAKATEIGRLGTADAVSDMNTLGTTAIVSDMDTLADISSNITTVAGISGNVTTVANNNSNVTTVAGISSNVTSVANNSSNINSAVSNATNINSAVSNATNINSAVSNASNINTVAGSISAVNSTAGSISNVNTVASNINSVNDFASQYRIGSSNPTSSLDVGDLFFNTTSNSLKVYTGSAWVDGVTATGNFAVVTGNTFTGSNLHNDNVKSIYGTGSDFEIFHDGSNNSSIIRESGAGFLSIQSNGSYINFWDTANNGHMIQANTGGTVQLFHAGSEKFKTVSSGVEVFGNITVGGTVDGRDVAADGTKLDGIDTSASSFANVVEDTTPQLGGDLDMNGNSISSGTLNVKNTGSQSEVRLFCEVSNAHYVSIKAPAHSAYSGNITYTLPPTATNGQYIKTDANGNLSFAAPTENDFTTTLKNKLDGIESGATGDQTASEVLTLLSNQNITTTGTFGSGDITITGGQPSLKFIDDGANPDYNLYNNNGVLRLYDITNTADRLVVNTDGHIDVKGNLDCEAGVDVTGNISVTGTVDGVDVAALNTTVGNLGVAGGAIASATTATTQAQSDNSTKVSTTAYVRTAVANVVNSAPGALDTLNELAAALGDDANFSTTTANTIATKLPKSGGQMTGNITMSGSQTVDGRDLSVDGSKLDGIESGATADQTAAEIRTLVESASDSNVFTDADHSKLNGIEASATADQTASEIASALNGQNVYTTGNIGRDSNDHIVFTNDSRLDVVIAGNNEFRFENDGVFHADGDVIAQSTTISSDRKLKENIQVVPNALDKVEALNGVTFDWKRDGTPSAGVIAQEVQEVLPEAVKEVTPLKGGDSHLSVNYHALTSILIEAIKELKAEVEQLKGGQ